MPVIDGWTPGIGDPTPLGWITTIAYALAAWLCVRASAAARVRHGAGPVRARRFWSVMAVAMAALAINKQLDLQSLLTAVGRHMAQDERWYDMRRAVQRAFIVAMMLAGGIALVLLLRHLRHATMWIRLAGLGATFLITFVVIRAASFHHVDVAIHAEWAGVYINHLLELSGIITISLGAIGDCRRATSNQKVLHVDHQNC